jgi:hypothetical protein
MSKLLAYYTKKRDVVTLPDDFNEELEIGDFLKTTKKIIFGRKFNKKIAVGVIPPKVKEIVFGIYFDQELEVGVFPNGITSIIFGIDFNRIIKKGVFPESLIALQFGSHFAHDLEPGVLPVNLEKLIFWGSYKQLITKGLLPPNLKYLNIGENDIKPGALPESLESLYFGSYSIRLGEGFLPPNLKFLKLPHFYDKANEIVYPVGLEIIDFARCADFIVGDGVFPSSVHTVILCGEHNLILNSLPDSITTLVFYELETEITNISPLISKIKFRKMKHAQFLKKIPFGCEIETIGGNSIEEQWFN